ncbi:MAG TPA: ABC transporter permease [Puia sp.]|nr:ABC transporter permease [Puia sp.]
MLKNYFKIAWRNMIRDRQFTLLNLIGLATGIACALLIYLWVTDELSFDKFFANSDQMYQLMEVRNYPGHASISDESSGLLAETVKAQMPEVEYAASIAPANWFQKFTLTVGEKNIKAVGQYVGKDYFNIFAFHLIKGNKDDVLRDKSSIVISENLANKLFGTTENIVGKAVRFQQDTTFFISGIFEDQPHNSSEQFDFVLSFEYYGSIQNWVRTWYNGGPHNYVFLKKGTDINSFNKRVYDIITRNANDTFRKITAIPFTSAYLQNTFTHGARTGGRGEYVRLFSIIAIFILAIACINFMNLSTAKASRRLKEVGIKKVVGANRKQLIFQFLSESVLLTFISMIFALIIALILLPEFNRLTDKHLSIRFDPEFLFGVLGITLFTGIISGSYPALYLSGFSPISILKNKLSASIGEVWARKGLVVFQFAITVTLIVAVLIVYKQISLIQSVNLGYNKDNIIRFNAEGKVLTDEQSFIDGLKKIPGVINASNTAHDMVGRNFGGDMVDWPGRNPNENYYFEGVNAGYNFIETMGMQMAEGRSYSKSFASDSAAIIFNETAIRTMGLKNPIGKTVKWFGRPVQIIGIVKDFHFESLHQPVVPVYIGLENGSWADKIMIKIASNGEKETITRIEDAYEKYNPGFPFEFNFLDDAYQKQYAAESRVSVLSRYFAGLAIVISCLGLFGLAAFTAQRRQKEIGIRKIIGASVSNIFLMLSKDFLILVLIAILIAFPLSWWAMNKWLQSFAYRINISATIFIVAGASIIFITLTTISYQALKAAVANPVRSLRSE